MRVALVSIGHCPSLALRNIRTFCLSHDDVRGAVQFDVYDYEIQDCRAGREQQALQWSFTTKFDEALTEFRRTNPAIIAFTCYLWNTELSVHLAHLAKQVLPDVCIVLGGPDAGPRAVELLQRHSELDIVIDGDGEIPFLHLVRQFLGPSGPDLERVPSTRYRAEGKVAKNPPPLEQLDLSRLTDVCADLPEVIKKGRWGWRYVSYETLRGCPYSCSYCMYGKTKMNEKNTALAAQELLALVKQGLVVNIIDPTFTTYQKRAKEILRELGRHEYPGGLYFEAYPDSIDDEMAELMVGARVSIVGLGFQTISTEGLKAVKRPKNLQRFERAVGLLKAHSITYYADIIYGLPQTTVDDFLTTADYLYEVGVPTVVMYRLLGLPGSPMMADAEKYGLTFSSYPPYELLSSNTYSLDDVIFCERYQQAFQDVLRHVPDDLLRKVAVRAGGISNVVKRYLAEGQQVPSTFRSQLREEQEASDRPPETVAVA